MTPLQKFLIPLFAGAGVLHFAKPQPFDDIVPDALPGSARSYTYVSGAAELAAAALLANPKTRAAGGVAAAFRQDVASKEDNEAAVQFAVDTFGALHLAVNNAGVGDHTPLADKDLADWDKVIAINLSGVAYGCHYQLKQFLAQGNTEQCAIVNMSSIHGSVGRAGGIEAYTAAKHGVVGLTKSLAADYAATGIRVNCVGPAYIDTPLIQRAQGEARQALVDKHPAGRLGEPEEIAAVVSFLLSDDASFVNGSYHLADGGYTAV